jgi:hypothetical protein
MTSATPPTAPGVRLRSLASERARIGTPIDLAGRVLRFVFDDDSAKADKATLTLDNHDLALLDRPELVGGALWEVSWGVAHAMAPPRRVVVRKLTGFEVLTLEAHSLGVLLDTVAKTRAFRDRTPAQVIRQIATEHGFDETATDVDEDLGPAADAIVQAAETDAHLVRRLAARAGRRFVVDDAGFHVRRPRPARRVSHTYTWRADDRLLNVNVESNLAARVGRVEVRAHDPRTKRTVTGVATGATVARPTLADVVEVVDPETGKTALTRRIATVAVRSGSSPSRVASDAESHFLAAESEAITLTAQVTGDASLVSGALFVLRGISARLSGLYHARAVRHAISSEGYTCDLTLVRDGVSASTTARGVGGERQGGQKIAPPAASTAPAGTLRAVERVDPETGRTVFTYVTDGAAP